MATVNAKNDSSAQRDPWRTTLADCWTEAPSVGVEREPCTIGGAIWWRSFHERSENGHRSIERKPWRTTMSCTVARRHLLASV